LAISEGSLSFLPLGAEALIDAAVTSGAAPGVLCAAAAGKEASAARKKRGD